MVSQCLLNVDQGSLTTNLREKTMATKKNYQVRFIDSTAHIEKECHIGNFVIIEENVIIESNTKIWHMTRIGANTRIGECSMIACHCELQDNVTIGKRVRIEEGCFVSSGTQIGDDVFVGPHSSFLNDPYPMQRKRLIGPNIENNVVIGAGVIMFPVKAGEGAVVGAGSLVLKDVPANTVVYGHPARVAYSRKIYEDKKRRYLE